MNKPNWITFTGVDAYTDLGRLAALTSQYKGRVEWGVLFSANQRAKGKHRYPPELLVQAIRNIPGVNLSAHLCGKYADLVNKGAVCPVSLRGFGRVQVNHKKPDINTLNNFAESIDADVIAQSRDEDGFAMGGHVYWLFDPSGGRGERPSKLPKAIGGPRVGYAGGINPENVTDVISNIDAESYWIDMESGVRNEHDLFDLDKCKAVLNAVYGKSVNCPPASTEGTK